MLAKSTKQGRAETGTAERGATLLEAALALSLIASTIALVNVILSEEAERQRDVLLGRDLRLMTTIARSFASDHHEDLKTELAALPQDDAIMAVGMQRLADAGYLPAEFLSNGMRKNSFGQEWLLLVRAVDLADADRPRPTLAIAEIDADDDGAIDAELADGTSSNGELDLEVLLVTSGGEAVPARNGNPAVIASGLSVAGFVQQEGHARGPHGNWEMDITPFTALDGDPAQGSFASMIALAGLGVLDGNWPGSQAGGQTGHLLDRCPGASGNLLFECLADNEMYSEIAFDTAPDASPDQTAAIRNLYTLAMGPPVDSDEDGVPDILAVISGVDGIGCNETMPDELSVGTLIVDCPSVKMEGDLETSGSVTADSFYARSLAGQNLAKGIYAAHLVALDPEPQIGKPSCEGDAGSPAIYTLPVSYISPGGDPLVGVQTFAEDHSDPGKWKVRMKAAIDADEDGDGYSDVVELNSESDLVLALTKCD